MAVQDDMETDDAADGVLSVDDGVYGRPNGPTQVLGLARRTVGMFMLALVIFLWTASNFLGSAVLADETYDKPFCLTYLNTSFFVFLLVPGLVGQAVRRPGGWRQWLRTSGSWFHRRFSSYEMKFTNEGSQTDSPLVEGRRQSISDSRQLLLGDELPPAGSGIADGVHHNPSDHLSTSQTARLGLEFSILWFLANYWIAASLMYTTVASSTILTSTSSVFTLLFGVLFRVELFTWRKLIGILASLAGIALVSSVDFSGMSGDADHRGDFPKKTPRELAIGNALAFLSAVTYGIYTVLMKKRIDDESKISMPLFFGFVGLWNMVLLWPGFFLLHWFRVETFDFFPNGQVAAIVTINCVASLTADVCWGYAVLLTSPIVVTVGLSLTIPLSLVGQMVLNAQTATAAYWVGAVVVVASFVFINHEEKKDEVIVQQLDSSGVLVDRSSVLSQRL